MSDTRLSLHSFPKLDLAELKACARNWSGHYPCIEEVRLYRSALLSDPKKYILVIVAPGFSSGKLPDDENEWTDDDVENNKIIKYYDWVDPECSNIQEDIVFFYKDRKHADVGEWMIFSITPSEAEDIDSFNAYGDDPFIDLESELVLFSRIETSRKKIKYLKKSKGTNPIENLTPNEQLDKRLIEVDKDIQRFYRSLKIVMKKNSGLFNATEGYAQEAFTTLKAVDLSYMRVEHLCHDGYGTDQPIRSIQGNIAKNMIEDLWPDLAIKCTVVRNHQGLYEKMKMIRKAQKK